MSIEKFLTDSKDNNMQENRDSIIESYCEAIIEKHREQIESKGFEIVKTDKDVDRSSKWRWYDSSYPFIIKPKNCDEYYFGFYVQYFTREEKYIRYGVRIFQQDSDTYADTLVFDTIAKFLNVWDILPLCCTEKRWEDYFDTSMAEFESSLQEFLDSNKIKELNEKLKILPIFRDTQYEIKKAIESNYKDYVVNIEECIYLYDISIWHKDFDREEISFNVEVKHDNKKCKVCFMVKLGCFEDEIPAMFATIKEILGVDDSAFHIYTYKIEHTLDSYSLMVCINLADYEEINPKDFTKEKFINFFESVRKQTDSFNQKIKDDLAKGQDSKLAKFLPSEDD